MSETQNKKEDDRQWFLRTGGETVFGPVSTQGLIVWAEQGRILPGHEVSTDRKKWVQAVSVELLDMRWFVDDGGGELRGPLNRLAAEALLKSGKVRENAQLISADEVELAAESEKEPRTADKVAREPVPEDVLRVRIRELESMVSGQRERLVKLSNVDAIETVQHERDVMASLVKELETERDTLLRNAEKDARTSERKLEQMRQQIKKLEQQLEDVHSRLLLSDQAVARQAETVTAEEVELRVAAVREEAALQKAALAREVEGVHARLAEAELALETAHGQSETRQAEQEQENSVLRKRVSEMEQTLAFFERREEETRQILDVRETELASERRRVAEGERRIAAAELQKNEAEAQFAELLSDANARDTVYVEKIAALEKACALPPEETARFLADQAAVFELVKCEVDDLAESMELERKHVEQLKEWSMQRQQSLVERRQLLLKQLGCGPADMTRRAVREQPADPNAVRLRTELENMRNAHQRELRQAEERERDLQRKLRVQESDSTKLQGLAMEGEKVGRRLQELGELLRRRDQELSDERRNREAEREQFQGSQQALLLRIEQLEKASRTGTPDEIQSAEAHNVKIATWMRLKK
jgi:hypothetical protein